MLHSLWFVGFRWKVRLNLSCGVPRRNTAAPLRLDGVMSIPADATLADLGEFGLVDALAERFTQGEQVLLGPGDDSAVVAAPDGRVVVSTDLHVDGRHFRRDWASASDIGHRVAAANLSDINAMGGRATALTVGLAAPADLPAAWVLELADGIAAECSLVGASVVCGDLAGADQVAIAGRQGWAAGGLAVLARGFRSPRKLVEAYRRPEPPYAAGAEAAAAGATSMIDVSDGLLADVGHLAEDSGVAIHLRTEAFEV